MLPGEARPLSVAMFIKNDEKDAVRETRQI